MIETVKSQPKIIDIEDLGFDRGAHLLIKRALADVSLGEMLGVRGSAPDLELHLRSWCRSQGFKLSWPGDVSRVLDSTDESQVTAWILRDTAFAGRWRHAETAGGSDPNVKGAVVEHPPAKWGLAARGASIESGGPEFYFPLDSKSKLWADSIPRLYQQAAAAQWDPATAIDWSSKFELPSEIETAVVQVMTYLIENETAALLVPARFLAQIHPHFREAMQLLAVQVADEARHIEVFTRRATLCRERLGLSTVGGQASLKTLMDESDFTISSFLLSVLGEGTFLNLLWFLQEHAPDAITQRVAQLAAQDEARHVAFGMGHLQYQISADAGVRQRLAAAARHRHDTLANTTGLNEEVFDALVILSAGEWTPAAIASGFDKVTDLKRAMNEGRRQRLSKLGFSNGEAEELSSLHTRNFM